MRQHQSRLIEILREELIPPDLWEDVKTSRISSRSFQRTSEESELPDSQYLDLGLPRSDT